jgi:hypothetical protein
MLSSLKSPCTTAVTAGEPSSGGTLARSQPINWDTCRHRDADIPVICAATSAKRSACTAVQHAVHKGPVTAQKPSSEVESRVYAVHGVKQSALLQGPLPVGACHCWPAGH